MKSIIFTIVFLFFAILPAGAVKKITANPINVAVVLVEKADSTNIDEYFKYYGYSSYGTEDGYTVMKHPNGDEIHYSFKREGISLKHSSIKVKVIGTHKDLGTRLTDLNFHKSGNVYERSVSRYQNYITRGYIEESNNIILEKIQKR